MRKQGKAVDYKLRKGQTVEDIENLGKKLWDMLPLGEGYDDDETLQINSTKKIIRISKNKYIKIKK